jgi:transposase InsO family protein
VLPVGGHEDHDGPRLGEHVHELRAAHPRHLHVEEDRVGEVCGHDGEPLPAVRRSGHHLDSGLLGEQVAEPGQCERLVLHHHDAQQAAVHAVLHQNSA